MWLSVIGIGLQEVIDFSFVIFLLIPLVFESVAPPPYTGLPGNLRK